MRKTTITCDGCDIELSERNLLRATVSLKIEGEHLASPTSVGGDFDLCVACIARLRKAVDLAKWERVRMREQA